MSKVNSKKLMVKFAGILVPIFLSMLVPQFGAAQNSSTVQALFSISPTAVTARVLSDYGLLPSELFSNTYKADVDLETFLAMEKDPRFAYVEKDARVKAAVVIPSDPFFTTDPGLADKQWYLAKTHVPDAWEF